MGEWSRITGTNSSYTLHEFSEHLPEDLTGLSQRHVTRWLESLSVRPSTRRKKICDVRVFLDWLVSEGEISTNVLRRMQVRPPPTPRKVVRVYSEEEIRRLFAVLPDKRAACIVVLAFQLGLRRKEIVGLSIEDLDWAAEQVWIREGKGGHERVIDFPPAAQRAVRAYLDEHPASFGPLIRSYVRPDRPLGPHRVTEMWTEWAKAAGIWRKHEGKSAHGARRTMATHAYELHGDPVGLQHALGHHDVSVIQHYVRIDAKQVRDVMRGRDYPASTGDPTA